MPPTPCKALDESFANGYFEKILSEIRGLLPQQPRVPVRYRMVKDGVSIYLNWFVTADEVVFIHTEDGSVNVHLHTGVVLKGVNLTLKAWLDLNLPAIIQVHRKTLVNLKYVGGFSGKPDKGRHTVLFKTGAVEFEIGDRYFKAFKIALEGYAGL